MNTDIGFLRALEQDLTDAAVRAATRSARSGELVEARHGMAWTRVAAVLVPVLVVAGGIGFLAQHGWHPGSVATTGANYDSRVHAGIPAPYALSPSQQGGSAVSPPAGVIVRGTDLSKIVRNGSISVEIPNDGFATGRAAVARIASDAHGFILSSTTSNETSGTFTMRVPASNFELAMSELEKLGTVESSKSSGKDVTAQFVDYTVRLRVLDGRRAVILRLLSNATTISDTLRLENVFDDVQLQIEQIQGNLNVLRNQVSESTIAVDIHETDAPKATSSTVSTPHIGTSFRLAWQGFLRVIGAVVIGLGYLIPLTVLALVIWVVTRVTRKRRATA
jgi:hypothetical protein